VAKVYGIAVKSQDIEKKLHILHVTYDMEIGGAEQVIMQLVKGLDSAKYTSSVLCINDKIGSMGIELQNDGVQHYSLGRQPGLDFSLIKSIRELLREIDVDVLHCHQYTPYTYGVLAAMFMHKKVIYTEHGRFYPDSYSWKRRLINPIISRATDSTTAISAATKDALVHYEWFPARSIEVIYNGLKKKPRSTETDSIRSELGLTTNQIIAGTISRLDPIKNQTMMIHAFDLVRKERPDCVLLLVGDGPERETLEQQVSTLNLQDHVIFTGFKTDPKPYLDLIDVFLLSSHSEGTSMTLLESMSEGKPCVVTAVGGNVEILDHEISGMIVDSGDTKGFADAVLRLLNDSALFNDISAKARQAFNEKFELQYMIDAYQLLYDD